MTTLEATRPPIPTGSDIPEPRRFTVDEYDRMADTGILGPDDRVELIEGVIYAMPPQSQRHAARIEALTTLLVLAVQRTAGVRVQLPISLGLDSEPEPDVAIVSTTHNRGATPHPGPDDIHLIIEVMLSSARMDCQWKLPLYAKHGIREVWLVDLNQFHIEVHTEPQGGEFSQVRIVQAEEEVRAAAIPSLVFMGTDLLGPPVVESGNSA